MQTSAQETFKEISQVQENSSCFECGKDDMMIDMNLNSLERHSKLPMGFRQ